MERQEYRFVVSAENQAMAGLSAQALADTLREAEGVLEADHHRKADERTMDLGSIVDVIANSGATLAVAYGIASWLRTRQVTGIDAEAATRIAEIVRG